MGESTDREAPPSSTDNLTSLVTAFRWGTTTLGLLWAAALRSDGSDLALGVVLLAYSLWRTFRPVAYSQDGWRSLTSIVIELAVTLSVIVSTGCWESTYIFALFTPVIAAGFAQGFWHASRIALAGALTVGIAAVLLNESTDTRPITAFTSELVLTAIVASYGRHLLNRAEEVRALSIGQLWQLNEANSLLVNLNRLSHDLSVSFDFDDTIRQAVDRVRDATRPDVIALLLSDPLEGRWNIVMAEGAQLPESISQARLPAVMQAAVKKTSPVLATDLSAEKPGLVTFSRSGVYVPLWVAGRQIGLLAVEASDADRLDEKTLELLSDLAEPIALTIDNARWFDRLRARGAAQERTRIARDLHDRVGQGIAYVAFELDRLCRQADGSGLEGDLSHLRDDARNMVRELRETLYDLRTDVSAERGIVEIITEFLARVGQRSNLTTSFEHETSGRLSIAREREVWRIAQEAIINVERHAAAQEVAVRWDLDEHRGVLTIRDDGVGMQTSNEYGESASPGRPSYGLTGMRERADVIGARLEIKPNEPSGTVVRLHVSGHQPSASQQTILGNATMTTSPAPGDD